jgi:ParB-like chromosome segregation protein Spo0J
VKNRVRALKRERRYVPLDTLTPWPGNARRGDVELVRESLRTHGQYRDLVVQAATGKVIAGNHTFQALKLEGAGEAWADFVDVDDAQAERIHLMDNRASDKASYDNEALLAQLAGVGDLDGTGWTQADYDELVNQVAGLTDELLDADDAPEDNYAEQYGVIVMCRDEGHQREVYELLQEVAQEKGGAGPVGQALDIKVVTT